jgi:hypothetical protein
MFRAHRMGMPTEYHPASFLIFGVEGAEKKGDRVAALGRFF